MLNSCASRLKSKVSSGRLFNHVLLDFDFAGHGRTKVSFEKFCPTEILRIFLVRSIRSTDVVSGRTGADCGDGGAGWRDGASHETLRKIQVGKIPHILTIIR